MHITRYTPEEAAVLLHVSEPTLERWRRLRTGPPWGRIGRRIFYPAEELADWVAAQVQHPAR